MRSSRKKATASPDRQTTAAAAAAARYRTKPNLDAQRVVLEVAVPGRDRELGARGDHALHALRKCLRAFAHRARLRPSGRTKSKCIYRYG